MVEAATEASAPTRATPPDIKPQGKPYEPNRLLQAGTYALAGLAGLITARLKIWDIFYEKTKKSWGTRQLKEERNILQDIFIHTVATTPVEERGGIMEKFIQVVNGLLPNANNLDAVKSFSATHDLMEQFGDLTLPPPLDGQTNGIASASKVKKVLSALGIKSKTSLFDPALYKGMSIDDLIERVGNINLSPAPNAGPNVKVSRQGHQQFEREVQSWYNSNRKAFMKEFDFTVDGFAAHFKGALEQIDDLSAGKKFGIAFTTAASIVTIIGAYMLVNQNAKLKHELGDMHNRLGDEKNTAAQR